MKGGCSRPLRRTRPTPFLRATSRLCSALGGASTTTRTDPGSEDGRPAPGHERIRQGCAAFVAPPPMLWSACNEKRAPGLGPVARNGNIADDHSRRCCRPTFRTRPPRPAAPRGDRQHGRHDDRMVRFSGVRPDGGAGLREIVFSEVRPAHRHLGGVRRLRGRLRCTADRRGDLRALRRSHRPQGRADRDLAADRPVDVSGRLRPHL